MDFIEILSSFKTLYSLETSDYNKALDFSEISIGEIVSGSVFCILGVLGSLKTPEFYSKYFSRILFFLLGIFFTFSLIVIQKYIAGNASVVFPMLLALLSCCITGFVLVHKKTIESLIEEYRNNHCGVRGSFFDDIKQAEELIKDAKNIEAKGIEKEKVK